MSATLQQLHASWVAKKEYAIRHGRPLPDYEWVERLLAEADRLAAENARLRELAAFKRNTRISDSHGFKGDWVAVPFEDFSNLRAEVAASGARAVLAERPQ